MFGYLRRPVSWRTDPGQLPGNSGWEVCFVLTTATRLREVRTALEGAGFKAAPARRRFGVHLQSVVGRPALERFLKLLSAADDELVESLPRAEEDRGVADLGSDNLDMPY
jgi:hypothetical protein